MNTTTTTLIALTLAISMITTGTALATSDEYHIGYETGCNDSSITDSNQRQVQSSADNTEQFNLGYEHGFLECSGFDRTNNFNCGFGSDGCNGLVYCHKINSMAISCYDEGDTE